MFVIDENGSIAWFSKWVESDGPVTSAGFDSLRGLTKTAETRGWSKQTVTDIWNGFAGAAGFADLKPQKLFKNRPYGLEAIWKAIQRLVPADVASEPVAPKTTCQECNGSGEEDGDTCMNCFGEGYLDAVADTVENMPKKKSKPAKAKKAARKAQKETVPPPHNTKRDDLVALVSRTRGASVGEIMEALGWQAHSVRGAVSTLKSKHGLNIVSEKSEKRGLVYKLAA